VRPSQALLKELQDVALSRRGGPPRRRKVPCTRCAGEAISWVHNGTRYFGPFCEQCSWLDFQWSIRRRIAAVGEPKEIGIPAGEAQRRAERIEALHAEIERYQARRTKRESAPAPEPKADAEESLAAWVDEQRPMPREMTPEEFEARRLQQLEDLERRGGW
jgi:endogenous inhibitor of DNA gyrase (YacG/DUF329 family)